MSAKTITASNSSSQTSLATLPPELLLEIIPQISYSPESLLSLILTSRTLHNLIKSHEYSLTRSITHHQIPQKQQSNHFPSLDQITTFANLSTYHTRLQVLSNLVDKYPSLGTTNKNNPTTHTHHHCPSCSTSTLWLLNPRWSTLHKTGLLLLYRLQDQGSYCHKVALLNGLPAISLACMLLALLAQNRILRASGLLETLPKIEGNRWWESSGGGTKEEEERRRKLIEMRETEMVCEEMGLKFGVGFYGSLFEGLALDECGVQKEGGKESWARKALETELASLPYLQTAFFPCCGAPRPPTLTSCLRRAFAAKCHCQFSEIERKLWEVLSNTALDEVDETLMGKIVRGEDDFGKRGMRRIF
ncbi:hypothetical protein CB0940_08803 [Cercospora beticola]|uniref:F-box domain-containing protein n=1 Tax=Cercospora beticola TaxID=122368 RepID=A0A2G5HQ40_CERBT|nr:hypothetical protein CB0940_08803 [Cercospora beticola]PIA94667.1 hypothetical protein CB0940_08803 [Cercospora beticola]